MTDGDGINDGAATEKLLHKGLGVAIDSGVQIIHALGMDKVEAALFSGIAKGEVELAKVLPEDTAANFLKDSGNWKGMAAMFYDPEINRAYFVEEAQKRGFMPYNGGETVHEAPKAPNSPTPQTEKEKIIAEQRLLKEAGYENLLTRRGEGNGGIDGVRGRDTIAAENQFRKDHHLAADAPITGGESVHSVSKTPETPSVLRTGKGPKLTTG